MSEGKLIVLANVKGGTGKSTLAVNLAATAASAGKKVMIIDTDHPQFNAASWHLVRVDAGKEDVNCSQITTPTIPQAVKNLLKQYDFVIVDSGARDTGVMRSAMVAVGKYNGILVIPLTTSQFDIWASEDTFKLLKEVKSMIDDIRAFFVLNRIITGTRLDNEFKQILEDFEQSNEMLPSLKSHIYQRVDLINCLESGSSAIEINKKGEAANEIIALYNEINSLFEEKQEA